MENILQKLKQVDDIKNSVIKTLAIAGGIFGVINFGDIVIQPV